jgi:hypothetical protein
MLMVGLARLPGGTTGVRMTVTRSAARTPHSGSAGAAAHIGCRSSGAATAPADSAVAQLPSHGAESSTGANDSLQLSPSAMLKISSTRMRPSASSAPSDDAAAASVVATLAAASTE